MLRRLLIAGFLLAAVTSLAHADAPTAVDRALGGVEWSASTVRASLLTPSELVDVARNPDTAPIRRRRAIALMRLAPTAEVRNYVTERLTVLLAADASGSSALELAALLPLSAELNLVKTPALEPLLSHHIAAIRQAAVVAITTLDKTPRARELLTTHLAGEHDSGVRAEIARRLAK